jgi:hypothetical protein
VPEVVPPDATAAEAAAPGPSAPTCEELAQQIRREVEPQFWSRAPGATLEARNGIVIARASPNVLQAIADWLEARRKGTRPEEASAVTPEDPAAAEELRALLRAMLDRHLRLETAVGLLRKDPVETRILLDGLEAEEPDNVAVRTLRRAAAAVDGDRVEEAPLPPRWGPIRTWRLHWTSAATHARLSELVERAGPAANARVGEAIEEVLRRGHMTVRVRGVPAWVAVRAIEIESGVEVSVARDLASEIESTPVTLDEVARSLDVILDALVAQLPADIRWVAEPSRVSIVRGEAPPEQPLRTTFFDVRDLFAPPDGASAPASPAEAPVVHTVPPGK